MSSTDSCSVKTQYLSCEQIEARYGHIKSMLDYLMSA